MAASYPPYTPTTFAQTGHYVIVTGTGTATGDLGFYSETATYGNSYDHERALYSADLERRFKAAKRPFFSAQSRAPLPSHVHQQAPRARPRPVQRLHHFASPKVWARRNKPTEPRRTTNAG